MFRKAIFSGSLALATLIVPAFMPTEAQAQVVLRGARGGIAVGIGTPYYGYNYGGGGYYGGYNRSYYSPYYYGAYRQPYYGTSYSGYRSGYYNTNRYYNTNVYRGGYYGGYRSGYGAGRVWR